MIDRYVLPEMGELWTENFKFHCLLKVERVLAQVQAKKKIIPHEVGEALSAVRISIERIQEIEQTTKHEVMAFVLSLAEQSKEWGPYFHYGMTSSDILDTALSLQVLEAEKVLNKSLQSLEVILAEIIQKHAGTLCVGRTHGMHGEPTTFGFKLLGYYSELKRHKKRLKASFDQMKICKLSGAVGTYSGSSQEVEEEVAMALGLSPEPVATQIIPRDRHGDLMQSLSLYGCLLERLALELRHLQRSEVGEVEEGFSKGQKGSSVMPHKKNPISAENIMGLMRLLRNISQGSLENIILWHERDISHSSYERVLFPDAFCILHYATERMVRLLKNFQVREDKMIEHLKVGGGRVFSSQILKNLVQKGAPREEAYEKLQTLAHAQAQPQFLDHAFVNSDDFQDRVFQDEWVSKYLSNDELKQIFDGRFFRVELSEHVLKTLEKLKQ